MIGLSWIGLLRFITKTAGFVKIILLARLLTPEQFGAFSIALLVVGILEIFTETGVNVILVQERSFDKFIHSAWIISIIRGVVISFIIALSAPYIATFFHTPSSIGLLYVISFAPLLKGFVNPATIRFQKELSFQTEFLFRSPGIAIDAIVSVVSCFLLRSPLGIILGMLLGIVVDLILSFLIAKPRPHFVLERQSLGWLFNRGKWITASGIFNYIFHNADNVVVGRMLGAGPLGIYQIAYSLSIVPITEIAEVFSRVIFPVFTKISGDKHRLRSAFIKTIAVVSILSIPYGVLLSLFPKEIVSLVLGASWLPAKDILPILATFGTIRAISGTTSALFLAVGKQEYVTLVTFISAIGLIIPIVPLVSRYGLQGAALSALVGSVIALPIMIYFTITLLRYNTIDATNTRKNQSQVSNISK